MNREEFKEELKFHIADTLNLQDEELDEIEKSSSFNAVDLDSIDMLELSVAIEKKYKIKLKDKETAQKAFQNFETLMNFIIENSPVIEK